MSNILYRIGSVYTIPEVPAIPATPAYTYTTTSTRISTGLTTPSSWAYQVNTGSGDTAQSIALVFTTSSALTSSGNGRYINVPTTTVNTTHTVAATAGTPGTPAVRVESPPFAWVSTAHSLNWIVGTGFATFRVPDKVNGAAIGFSRSPDDPPAGYSHIQHGMVIVGSVVRSLRTGAVLGSHATADGLEVHIEADMVRFWIDGDVVGSEVNTLGNEPLYLASVLYGVGDYVTDPALYAEYHGGSTGSLAYLSGSSGVGTKGQAVSTLLALTGSSGVGNRSAGSMAPLEGFASDQAVFGQSIGSMAPFTSAAYGGFVEGAHNSYSDSALSPLVAAAHGITGEVGGGDTAMVQLYGIASDHNYTYSQGSMQPLVGVSMWEPPNEGYLTMTYFAGVDLSAASELLVFHYAGVGVVTTLVPSSLLDALFSTGAGLTTTYTTSSVIEALFREFITVGSTLSVPGASVDTWVVNVNTNGSTSYEGYDFNSYARIGDVHYGANESGLFALTGDDDNGEKIRAYIAFGQLDFGGSLKKTVQQCYVGMSASGHLYLKVIAEGREYLYRTRDFSSEMQQQRVTTGKGLRTNYVTLELYNSDGADFELDSVEFIVADMSRKI